MARVALYLPDEVVATLKREARRAKMSLSAFVAERLAPSGPKAKAAREKALLAVRLVRVARH